MKRLFQFVILSLAIVSLPAFLGPCCKKKCGTKTCAPRKMRASEAPAADESLWQEAEEEVEELWDDAKEDVDEWYDEYERKSGPYPDKKEQHKEVGAW